MNKLVAISLLSLALGLAACGTAPDGNPTVGGVEFTTGNAALNAKLISIGNKVDQGIGVAKVDIPALCQLAAKAEPVVVASPAVLNKSGAVTANRIASALDAWVTSSTCTNPVSGTLTDAVNLAQTIAAIRKASGGAVTASSIAAQ